MIEPRYFFSLRALAAADKFGKVVELFKMGVVFGENVSHGHLRLLATFFVAAYPHVVERVKNGQHCLVYLI